MIAHSPARNSNQTENQNLTMNLGNTDNVIANEDNVYHNIGVGQTGERLPRAELDIFATSVKLPQFWTNCPDAWFVQVEMQFATKNIGVDQTKYEYIITALPQEVIVKVLDVIQNPPARDRYLNLKKILIERHSLSESSRLDKVLSDREMGDRKPSEFYRSLALLAGSSFSQEVLVKLWLRKLPKTLNVALTGSNLRDVNELIRLSDKLWEAIYNGEVSSIRESSGSSNMENVVENLTRSLCESIGKLSLEVSSFKRQLEERDSRPRFRRFNRSSSRSRGRSANKDWLCRFHYRYGSKARRCEQPCSFSNEDSTN